MTLQEMVNMGLEQNRIYLGDCLELLGDKMTAKEVIE